MWNEFGLLLVLALDCLRKCLLSGCQSHHYKSYELEHRFQVVDCRHITTHHKVYSQNHRFKPHNRQYPTRITEGELLLRLLL